MSTEQYPFLDSYVGHHRRRHYVVDGGGSCGVVKTLRLPSRIGGMAQLCRAPFITADELNAIDIIRRNALRLLTPKSNVPEAVVGCENPAGICAPECDSNCLRVNPTLHPRAQI
jgi:hypothetical protein